MNTALDRVVHDELARLQAADVSGDFEDAVHSEIVDWIIGTSVAPLPKNMKDVIEMFWKERLN
jgi:hypothetical protein